ncbi:MAG: non-homologous end joining protein Ku [Gaiellaceae bacterium]
MPRAIWTGSIVFGLVHIPVQIYSAVHEHKVHFHLRHRKDGGEIGYEKICKLEGRRVPDQGIVRVYEYAEGRYVEVTDEDLAAIRTEGTRTIELEDFVPYDQIDPAFFTHTYLVGPRDGAERPYALLVRAMGQTGLAGIGKFVTRGRQYLGCLRIRKGVLTLEQMYFADEVDPPDDVIPAQLPSVTERELDMARALIENFSGEWKPGRYRDTYHDALCGMIGRKIENNGVQVPAQEPELESEVDLMAALRESVARARGGRDSRALGGPRGDRVAARRRRVR